MFGTPDAINLKKAWVEGYEGLLQNPKLRSQWPKIRTEIERIKNTEEYRIEYEVLEYNSQGFMLSVSQKRGLFQICCTTQTAQGHLVQDFSGRTKEGIAMEATTEGVEKVYGAADARDLTMPHDKRAGSGSLGYLKLGLRFRFRDNTQ